MNWKQIKEEQLSITLPLYDIEWVKKYLKDNDLDQDEYYLDTINGYQSIILGEAEYDDDFPAFMFGFLTKENCLDSSEVMATIGDILFKPLKNNDLCDPHHLEGYCAVFPDEEVSEKQLIEVVSIVLGKSLSNPEHKVNKIDTLFLKDHLSKIFSVEPHLLKRKRKFKLGKITFRTFSHTENNSNYTLADYEGRIISCYPL